MRRDFAFGVQFVGNALGREGDGRVVPCKTLQSLVSHRPRQIVLLVDAKNEDPIPRPHVS